MPNGADAERRRCRTARMPNGADAERRKARQTARGAERREMPNRAAVSCWRRLKGAVWHLRRLASAPSGICTVWHLRR
jgi:hypothetical protein